MFTGLSFLSAELLDLAQSLHINIILALYMYSYIVLVCILILFFSVFMDGFLTSLSFKVILNLAIRFRVRWLLIFIFINMAALPPSFFFFSKLSLLASVLTLGTWHTAVLFLGYVFFSWSIYYAVLRYNLISLAVTSPVTLDRQRLSTRGALVVSLLFISIGVLPFFFEDMFFFVYWLLV